LNETAGELAKLIGEATPSQSIQVKKSIKIQRYHQSGDGMKKNYSKIKMRVPKQKSDTVRVQRGSRVRKGLGLTGRELTRNTWAQQTRDRKRKPSAPIYRQKTSAGGQAVTLVENNSILSSLRYWRDKQMSSSAGVARVLLFLAATQICFSACAFYFIVGQEGTGKLLNEDKTFSAYLWASWCV
jgi:hypothetical protein